MDCNSPKLRAAAALVPKTDAQAAGGFHGIAVQVHALGALQGVFKG